MFKGVHGIQLQMHVNGASLELSIPRKLCTKLKGYWESAE